MGYDGDLYPTMSTWMCRKMRYPMVSPNIAIEKQENDNNLNKPMDLGVPYLQTNPEQKAMHVFVDVLHA